MAESRREGCGATGSSSGGRGRVTNKEVTMSGFGMAFDENKLGKLTIGTNLLTT